MLNYVTDITDDSFVTESTCLVSSVFHLPLFRAPLSADSSDFVDEQWRHATETQNSMLVFSQWIDVNALSTLSK